MLKCSNNNNKNLKKKNQFSFKGLKYPKGTLWFRLLLGGGGHTDTHADTHTDRHINTMTQHGLRAGLSEKKKKNLVNKQ